MAHPGILPCSGSFLHSQWFLGSLLYLHSNPRLRTASRGPWPETINIIKHSVQKNESYIVLTIQGTSKEVKLTTLNLSPGDTQKVATISWRDG